MPTFSHSRITSFETCPLMYKYAYIDRIRVEAEDTIETFLGIRVHEALEKLYRDFLYEKSMSLQELLSFFKRNWDENWKDTIIVVKEEYNQDNYRKMGERYLSNYYHRHRPFDNGTVIGLETKGILSLDKEGRYKFHIRIDRLMDMGDGLYEVHDYKTNTSLPKQEDLDQDRQLAMYSLWVRNQFKDFKKVRLVWHFVAFDKEMDSYRTREQLENLKKEVLEKIREIELAGEFPAEVSRLCDWCLYQAICPMWKHEMQLEEKTANEFLNDPGVRLVDMYVEVKKELDEHKREAEEKLEKLKEALVVFCAREGVNVVIGSENKITVKEHEALKFPGKNTKEREELLETLRSLGRLEEVSDLDLYALQRVLKSKDWDEKELAVLRAFGIKEKSYSLSVAKK